MNSAELTSADRARAAGPCLTCVLVTLLILASVVASFAYLGYSDAGLRPALEDLVEPATRGHPMSPLRWTCKSVRTLAAELTRQGHAVSHHSG